jgi:alpha-aminoadipic semialdehyde synthase
MVRPLQSGNEFELKDYYDRPERYRSVFADYLPFLTVIMNCIYWEPRFPRFVPIAALGSLFQQQIQPRLRVIGDISCDIEGSIECTRRVSTPDQPFFLCDPKTGEIRETPGGRGVLIMSIDNLPAEIPGESSLVFSKMLKPFLPELAAADFSGPFENLRIPDPIRRAVVIYRGELTPEYSYLNQFLGIS